MRPPPFVDPNVCRICDECSARVRCKPRAIVQIEKGDIPFVDGSRCRACYVCALDCPFGAIAWEKSYSR